MTAKLATQWSHGDYFLLRLMKCKGADDWTLHGLWWEGRNGCGGKFDDSAVVDLEPAMRRVWRSCPEYHNTDEWFWSHEWTKHGSCTKMSEHQFFAKALSLYSKHKAECDDSETECSVCFDAQLNPCGNVGTSSCECSSNSVASRPVSSWHLF